VRFFHFGCLLERNVLREALVLLLLYACCGERGGVGPMRCECLNNFVLDYHLERYGMRLYFIR